MIINTIDPVLFSLGPLQIRYYGVIYALGFILAYLFLTYAIRKGRITLTNKDLDDLFLHLIIGVVVGARLFHFIFYQPQTILNDPLEMLFIWHGGLSFHGGLVGAGLALYFFSRKKKISWISLADALGVPAALALALGRIANFTNHELYGQVTNVPWCVVFATAEGCRHPYQIYAALSHLLLFAVLLYVYFRQRRNGLTLWTFVFLYGALRFLTDFFRDDPRLLGISMGQFLSLVMALVGGYVLVKRRWRKGAG